MDLSVSPFLKKTSQKQARALQLGNEVKGKARWSLRALFEAGSAGDSFGMT